MNWKVCGCKFSHGTLNERLMSLMYLKNHPDVTSQVDWNIPEYEQEKGCGCLEIAGQRGCDLLYSEQPVHLHHIKLLSDNS